MQRTPQLLARLREWTREGNGEVEGVDKGMEWGG